MSVIRLEMRKRTLKERILGTEGLLPPRHRPFARRKFRKANLWRLDPDEIDRLKRNIIKNLEEQRG